jgi:copper chaperone CopZ
MEKVALKVQKEFCEECSLALRRFIGKMDGVASIDVGRGAVEITFDARKISAQDLLRISRESVEKLGYKTRDEE